MSDEARPSRKLWILAAVAALALHLGGAALALAHLRTDDDDDGLGASGAEFAVEMASPKAPETDLPPGPDSEAMQEQQALPEQKAETKESKVSRAGKARNPIVGSGCAATASGWETAAASELSRKRRRSMPRW